MSEKQTTGRQTTIRHSSTCHCALPLKTNKGSALYLSGIILQLVSRLSLVQFHFVIILTSEMNAKKKTVFTTRVKRAITRAV
ncbi:MAG TPA: hypothetical protein VFU37_21265, partial [Pyrinomonadaceae bacterium]|nr:hypothetical protein [Pyrinomonadaceae bacterium]